MTPKPKRSAEEEKFVREAERKGKIEKKDGTHLMDSIIHVFTNPNDCMSVQSERVQSLDIDWTVQFISEQYLKIFFLKQNKAESYSFLEYIRR